MVNARNILLAVQIWTLRHFWGPQVGAGWRRLAQVGDVIQITDRMPLQKFSVRIFGTKFFQFCCIVRQKRIFRGPRKPVLKTISQKTKMDIFKNVQNGFSTNSFIKKIFWEDHFKKKKEERTKEHSRRTFLGPSKYGR